MKLISTHRWSQVNFDPYSKFESTSMPRHKKPINFYPNTKTKSFTPPHNDYVNSDPYAEIKSSSIPQDEIN